MTGQRGNPRASRERAVLQMNQARRIPMNAQRAWRVAVGGVQLRLGRGLDSRIVLEELLIQLDEVLPLIGRLVLSEDRLDRAHRLASAAVDALVRMDVEHRVAFVDAVHRTHLDAGLVLNVDARLGDDVRHQVLPLARGIGGALTVRRNHRPLYPNPRNVSSIPLSWSRLGEASDRLTARATEDLARRATSRRTG